MGKSVVIKNLFIKFLFALLLLLLWEHFRPSYLPNLSTVFKKIIDFLSNAEFIFALTTTIQRCLIGLGISILLGITLGLLIGRNSFFERMLSLTIECLRPIPSSAIIPIAIILIGFNYKLNLFIIIYGSIWPVLINTRDASKNLGWVKEQTMLLLEISPFNRLRFIILPSCLDRIFTGIRISASIALILAVTVEIIVGADGIGGFLNESRGNFNYAELLASIIYLSFFGVVLNFLILKIEGSVIHWKNFNEN